MFDTQASLFSKLYKKNKKKQQMLNFIIQFASYYIYRAKIITVFYSPFPLRNFCGETIFFIVKIFLPPTSKVRPRFLPKALLSLFRSLQNILAQQIPRQANILFYRSLIVWRYIYLVNEYSVSIHSFQNEYFIKEFRDTLAVRLAFGYDFYFFANQHEIFINWFKT